MALWINLRLVHFSFNPYIDVGFRPYPYQKLHGRNFGIGFKISNVFIRYPENYKYHFYLSFLNIGCPCKEKFGKKDPMRDDSKTKVKGKSQQGKF